jgi:hypothetical protein
MLTVRVPLAVRKPRGGRKLILTPGGMVNRGASAADTTLVKALARAFRWRRMLETGGYGTIDELAAAEKINSSYVSRLLRLTLLAPDIVEAILDGRQPDGVTLPGLMEPFPVEWERQPIGYIGWPSQIWGANATARLDHNWPPSKRAMMGLPQACERLERAGVGSALAVMASKINRGKVSQPNPMADHALTPCPLALVSNSG